MDFRHFFEKQLTIWPECAQRYKDLRNAQSRSIRLDGREYRLFFNPARMKSVGAKVVQGKVDRPCFLCKNAIPDAQIAHSLTTVPLNHHYDVMVNPYPIVDMHFTIVLNEHARQELKGRIWDMAYIADMMPDFLVFFNGACSGASAPDHMHFQAVPKSEVPLIAQWSYEQRIAMGVTNKMPSIADSDNKNVICWVEGDEAYWLVIDRKQHRPWQYEAEGDLQCLISPAALEFCGLIPLAREEDYNKMDETLLSDILRQCERREPMLRVGIIDAQKIQFSADERTHAMKYVGENQIQDILDASTNRYEVQQMEEFWTHAEPFTLEDVTIGKQFHWEQKEDQIFRGTLHVIARDGELHAINLIPVEEYLKSVISSEMSATNNLELLKTHAIISRSWVMRQLESACNHEAQYPISDKDQLLMADVKVEDRIIRWWDHDDHTLYDVCADDHCQRYQGITREVSPLVAEAIEQTRGLVLVDDADRICDARFSKCCGGKSETFDTCWQDENYHYLQPVDDPYCNTSDKNVLRLVLNDYDQSTRDFYRWRVEYTQEELSDLIERKMQLGLGKVLQLVPLKRGASGRIEYLKVVGSSRTVVLGKELVIRKALSETHLYSSAFDVEMKVEDTLHFVLNGCGWGHGVGLCQIGAACMSVKGFTAEQILKHYFIGAQIKKIY